MRTPIPTLLITLGLWSGSVPGTIAEPGTEMVHRLTYVASYQGVLSAGLPLEIASVSVEVNGQAGAPLHASLRVSTQGFDSAEFLMPVRLCYSNRIAPSAAATQEAEWWSRIGAKAARGRLVFDHEGRRTLRLHAERKLQSQRRGDGVFREPTLSAARAEPDQDRNEATFPQGVGPMDQLTMLLWLRRQALAPGRVFEPGVTNGNKLTGMRAEVEGEDSLEWGGRTIPTYRIRLDPRVRGDSEPGPIWVWVSQSAPRMPLRFRAARGLGNFEAKLARFETGSRGECRVPEATGLALPTP